MKFKNYPVFIIHRPESGSKNNHLIEFWDDIPEIVKTRYPY